MSSKHLCLAVILMCWSVLQAPCQAPRPDYSAGLLAEFYPENKLIRKNGIKRVTATYLNPSSPQATVALYDSLGREIVVMDSVSGNIIRSSYYLKSGDTVFSITYGSDRSDTLNLRRYTFDKSGLVRTFLFSERQIGYHSLFDQKFHQFFYNARQEPTLQITYSKQGVSGKLISNTNDGATGSVLAHVIYYSYKQLTNGSLLVIKQDGLGKKEYRGTDSLIFDRRNRLLRSGTYSDAGFNGEMLVSHANRVKNFSYSGDSVVSSVRLFYCAVTASTGECLSSRHEETDDKWLVLLNKSGTVKEVYFIDHKGQANPKFRYIYSTR